MKEEIKDQKVIMSALGAVELAIIKRTRLEFFLNPLTAVLKGLGNPEKVPNPDWRKLTAVHAEAFKQFVSEQVDYNAAEGVTVENVVDYGVKFMISQSDSTLSELVKAGATLTPDEEDAVMQEFKKLVDNEGEDEYLKLIKLAAIGQVAIEAVVTAESRQKVEAEFNKRVDALREMFVVQFAERAFLDHLSSYKKTVLLLQQLREENIDIDINGNLFPADGNWDKLKSRLEKEEDGRKKLPLADFIKSLDTDKNESIEPNDHNQ